MKYDIIVIGAGLTGLSTAFFLQQKGFNVLVLEKMNRVGGAIQSHTKDGFVYEEGPNTGVINNTIVTELFEQLGFEPAIAKSEAEKRLILKNNVWHPLPSGSIGFLRTPLFKFSDKIKIAFEPWRKRGNDPNESVASLATRRIGQSFVDYAVNPFISGIYAGDPEKLITRYALPKLYNLEQEYGSFIGGTIKSHRKRKAEGNKYSPFMHKVFSGQGGFTSLIDTLKDRIGEDHIICGAQNVKVHKLENGYEISFSDEEIIHRIQTDRVVTTSGAHTLPDILPFVSQVDMDSIANLNYAKVIQVAVGVNRKDVNDNYISFGGLIPQKENKRLLGVLMPSFCFNNRAPDGYTTLAIYMGGTRHPEFINLPDEEIQNIIEEELDNLFQIPKAGIRFMKIFRHHHAIPQYEESSGKRFDTVNKLESENKGLIIAGNLRNGIGIADRIKQAYDISDNIS